MVANILVIDDEQDVLHLIKRILEKEGHCVNVKESALAVRPEDLTESQLIILDVMMPGVDGLSYCQKIRSQVACPIIFLTAKANEQDLLDGFASGGDDYITKPFSLKELIARVSGHLRRDQRKQRQGLNDGPIELLLGKQLFLVAGKEVKLTRSEFHICQLLFRHKEQVFSKEMIYDSLYGIDALGDSQTIITERVKNIRRKYKEQGEQPIKTVWGIGYRWEREG